MGNNFMNNKNGNNSIGDNNTIKINTKKKSSIAIGSIVIICVIGIVMLLVNSGLNDSKKFVGVWNEDGYEYISFYPDSTFKVQQNYGIGSYVFVGSNQIKLTDFYGEARVLDYYFEDKDTLILGRKTLNRDN